MSVRSGQAVVELFTTRVFATGVGTNADSLPAGTLYLNGTANAASVTVTNVSTGLYKAAVTLPTLAVGDEVKIVIAATVSSVSDSAVIWGDTKDILLDSSGDVTFNNTSIATVTTVTGQLTAAQIATGVWQDATAGDFTTASSIGLALYTGNHAPGAASGLAIVGSAMTLAASQHVIVDSGTVTTVTNQLTAAAIATGVWQDATASDFTAASSIGKSLFTGFAPGNTLGGLVCNNATASFSAFAVNGSTTLNTLTITGAITATNASNDLRINGAVPGAANGLFIAGTNAATTVTTALTTTFTGNLTGSVNSVATDVGITQAAADKVWSSVSRSLTTFGTLVADVATAVWAAVTRTLTAATNITSDGGTISQTQLAHLDADVSSRASQTSVNTLQSTANTILVDVLAIPTTPALTAAGTRSALGMASANLDIQLAAIDTDVLTRAPSSTALSTAIWTSGLATSLTTLAGHDPGGTLASRTNITAAVGVQIDTTQVVTLADVTLHTTCTVADALLAARAQAAGAWQIIGTALVLKNPDGSVFRTFVLDSSTPPITSRT